MRLSLDLFTHRQVVDENPAQSRAAVLPKSHNKRICLLSIENVWTR
jgi:hypothetical protein